MPDRLPGPVIAIVGPTGVGKSRLADDLAVRLGGEIVSADSMQVYRGIDIGTAKVPPSRRRVAYHCIDLVDPGFPYSAAVYQRDARDAIDGLLEGGGMPIVAGGSGLYVRAALDEMVFPAGQVSTATRERIEALAAEIGPVELHARLAAVDPAAARLIHPNNTRRVVRALEMLEVDGMSYAAQHADFGDRRPVYDTTFIGLTMERAALYALLDDRVDRMMSEGLLGEVETLLAAGYRTALTATQAIGYKELVPVLEGETDPDSAVAAIKQATRRYAKRQLTWFRADRRVKWLDVTQTSPSEAAASALALVSSRESR